MSETPQAHTVLLFSFFVLLLCQGKKPKNILPSTLVVLSIDRSVTGGHISESPAGSGWV